MTWSWQGWDRIGDTGVTSYVHRTSALLPRGGATMHAGDRGPLTAAQRRLWFLDRLSPGDPAYHICYPVRLRGDLDADRLIRAFDTVVAQHESLRTRFVDVDGMPMQEVLPPRRT